MRGSRPQRLLRGTEGPAALSGEALLTRPLFGGQARQADVMAWSGWLGRGSVQSAWLWKPAQGKPSKGVRGGLWGLGVGSPPGLMLSGDGPRPPEGRPRGMPGTRP